MVGVLEVENRIDPVDPDWKLRARWRFRAHNFTARVYCWLRGWV